MYICTRTKSSLQCDVHNRRNSISTQRASGYSSLEYAINSAMRRSALANAGNRRVIRIHKHTQTRDSMEAIDTRIDMIDLYGMLSKRAVDDMTRSGCNKAAVLYWVDKLKIKLDRQDALEICLSMGDHCDEQAEYHDMSDEDLVMHAVWISAGIGE